MEAALDSKQPSELTLERFRTDLPVARQAEQPLLGFETLLPTYPTASQRDRNKSERRHFGKMDRNRRLRPLESGRILPLPRCQPLKDLKKFRYDPETLVRSRLIDGGCSLERTRLRQNLERFSC